MINGVIYRITFPNKKYYIGLDSHWPNRKRQHISNAYNPNSDEYDTQCSRAIRKYGYKNIKWVLEFQNIKNKKTLCKLEIATIKKYNSYLKGYNSTLGGEGVWGVKWTKKRKHIASERVSGTANPFYGKHHSKQTKRNMKNNHRDYSKENHPFYGKHHSKQTKASMSKGKKIFWSNFKNRLQLSESRGGKPFNVFNKDTNEFIGTWQIQGQCAKDLNCSIGALNWCLHGKHKSHHGYIFKYTE